jgi:hypothetical protein
MQRKAYGKTLSSLQVCRELSKAFAVHQQINRVFPDCAAQISRNEDGNLCGSCLHRSVHRSPFARTVGSCDGFHGQSLVSAIKFYLYVTELVIIDRLGHRNWSVKWPLSAFSYTEAPDTCMTRPLPALLLTREFKPFTEAATKCSKRSLPDKSLQPNRNSIIHFLHDY